MPAAPPPRSPVPIATIQGAAKIALVRIDPGEFDMGAPDAPAMMKTYPRAFETASPRHKVRITRPFYLGKYEVTQEQYQAVVGINPSTHRGNPQLPVETVSWLDAVEFCNRLGAKEGFAPYYKIDGDQVAIAGGKGYRLPTEAEWEYACRARSQTVFAHGAVQQGLARFAWTGNNSGKATHPVGEKEPNPLGLHDMIGNVGEFCWDRYGPYPDDGDVDVDPAGPETGLDRVLRGPGAFWATPVLYTPFHRAKGVIPTTSDPHNGFRVARDAL
jgi:formylglycine-generating enzyme required for sulfatase activity